MDKALKIRLKGVTGRLLRQVSENWLKRVPEADPAILGMFRDRDLKPYRDLLPWSGEFAGKHLTGAYFVWRLTGDTELYGQVLSFIDVLLSLQDTDGYLGCYSKDCHLTGAFSQEPEKSGMTWDAWNHYHVMFGLLLWYHVTGDAAYLAGIEKAAELFLRRFYGENPPLSSIGNCEMNLAALHIFVLLYEETGKETYLRFAREIEKDLSSEEAGGYIENALEGREFYECRKPRWESLHVILGILELYPATGDKKYLEIVRKIADSILRTDVHNSGAFSTDEQAIGHPYKNGNIETCCAVAFDALLTRLYQLTGDAGYIDSLERAHYNAMLGAWHPSGRWSTYNTPMDGFRRANFDDIQFQCRPGSPELNCCSVNAPRGIAELSSWAVCMREDTLMVNTYEAMNVEGPGFEMEIDGAYPFPGKTGIVIRNTEPLKLQLRVPGWSRHFEIFAEESFLQDGAYRKAVLTPGTHRFTLQPDYSVHTEEGALDYQGFVSIFSGPLLYGADAGRNPGVCMETAPVISLSALQGSTPEDGKDGLFRIHAGGLVLTPFYRLGEDGAFYRSWFRIAP